MHDFWSGCCGVSQTMIFNHVTLIKAYSFLLMFTVELDAGDSSNTTNVKILLNSGSLILILQKVIPNGCIMV